MATTVARLEAVLTADTKHFDAKMDQSEGRMGKVSKAAGIAGAAIVGGLAVGMKHAINDASNLNEQISKSTQIFGKSAPEVQEWSKHLAGSFGLSQRAALEAAGTYGNMLKPMGVAPRLVKKMSVSMVELAGDMASFNNASPEETLDALRAGLAGETEPLRRFGVFLDQASIKAEAVSSGLVKTVVDMGALGKAQIALRETSQAAAKALQEHGKTSVEYQDALVGVTMAEGKLKSIMEGKVPELTAAQKAQASYNIIMKSTVDTQGDFARTSGGVANQQRVLKAELENLSASLGTMLLPIVQKVAQALSAFTGFMTEHTTIAKIVIGVIGTLGVALITFSVASKIATVATEAYTAAQWLLNAALSANPIALVIIALVALGAALVIAYKHSQTFRDIVDNVFDDVRGAVKALANAVDASLDAVRAAFDGVRDWIRDNWKAGLIILLGGLPGAMWVAFHEKWGGDFVGQVHDVFRAIKNWIKEHIVDAIVHYFEELPGRIGNALKDIGSFKLLDLLPHGDASNPNMGFGAVAKLTGGDSTIDQSLWDELSLGRNMGLTMTSGYRPGAITKHGTPSDHGTFPSKAIDMAGPASAMARFFTALIGDRGVKQAFYDPLGSIFGGSLSSYREGGHSDHVHVATYDKGGYLKPGWNLAYNGLGRPEPVGGGTAVFNLSIGGDPVAQIIWDQLRNRAAIFEQRNPRSAF